MSAEFRFETVAERLKQASKLSRDKDLAEFLGLSVTSFSNRKKAGTIPYEEICRACVSQNMNINWVFTGEGSPFFDRTEWVAPVAEIDPKLMAEITGELWKAFCGPEWTEAHRDDLLAAIQRSALAAQIFNKVAFVKIEKVRTTMVREQSRLLAEASRWLGTPPNVP